MASFLKDSMRARLQTIGTEVAQNNTALLISELMGVGANHLIFNYVKTEHSQRFNKYLPPVC